MSDVLVILAAFAWSALFAVLAIRADARAERAYLRWCDAQPWSAKSLAAKQAVTSEVP